MSLLTALSSWTRVQLLSLWLFLQLVNCFEQLDTCSVVLTVAVLVYYFEQLDTCQVALTVPVLVC